MKRFSLSILLALAALMLCPLAVMPAAAQAAKPDAEADANPRTGVRFVVVSPSGEAVPSPLYCKQGKSFRPLQISSRMPSKRVKPEAGNVVRFWKEDPGPAPEENATTGRGNRGGRGATATPATELPPPFMTVTLPSGIDAKTLCILVPTGDPAKPQMFFLRESDFPSSGVHLINFSPYPLQMILSQKGDFSDKKVSNIGFFRREDGVSAKNSWSYKGAAGESVAFMLMCKTPKAKEPRRVKASRFSVSDRQSQITVVVKDPKQENVKLLSIQLSEPDAAK